MENRLSYQARKLVVKGSKSNLAANHKQSFLDVDAGSNAVQQSINIPGYGIELTLTKFADDTKLGGEVMWRVDLGWPPGTHQPTLSFHLHQQERGRKYDKKFMIQDKSWEITYQLPSQAKQIQLEEINLIYCQLIVTEQDSEK